jgi:parvulin-like peptidyl-prolyl isomerase
MIALIGALVLIACGAPAVQTVARVDNVILSRQDLDKRIDLVAKGLQKRPQQPGQPVPSRLDIERQIVSGPSGFITQNLVLSLAKQRGVTITDKEVDDLIARVRDQVAQQSAQGGGGTFDETVQDVLGLPGAGSSEFRQFTSFILAQQKLGDTLVTTDTVRQQISEQIMAEANKKVLKATVAHILISVPENADAATTAAAEAKAKDVIARLDKGEKFEDLAKELSDDPGSKDKGGVYEDITPGQFVPEFDKAMFQDLQPGETTKTPVKTQFGYHVIRLISRAEGPAMTEEQAKQAIEQGLPQQLQQQRMQAFQKLVEEERTKAKQEGRIEEPTYPEPTAEPAQVQPTPAP